MSLYPRRDWPNTTLLGVNRLLTDRAGNRSSQASAFSDYNLPSAISGAMYDNANRQLVFGSYNMRYDSNGNVTAIIDGTVTNGLVWNARNQLTNMNGAVTASFVYDGFGRRITHTSLSMTENVLYDGQDTIIEKDNGGVVVTRYFRGLAIDEPWQRIDVATTNTNCIYVTDALGSVVALTDTNRVVQTQYTYDPFGATTTTGTGNNNAFEFAGREDDGTGLYNYRGRYYCPTLARFISEDPMEYLDGPNAYAYVKDSPIEYSDPSGLTLRPTGVKVCSGGIHTWLEIGSWSAGFYPNGSNGGGTSCGSGCTGNCGGYGNLFGVQGVIVSLDPASGGPKQCWEDYVDDCNVDITKLQNCIRTKATSAAPIYWIVGRNCRDWANDTFLNCLRQAAK